uniref:Secreted protein n=1 Tax=Rhipicephalus appendiculatus TaxID=34631 RepID=A0A131YC74_RHIAP
MELRSIISIHFVNLQQLFVSLLFFTVVASTPLEDICAEMSPICLTCNMLTSKPDVSCFLEAVGQAKMISTMFILRFSFLLGNTVPHPKMKISPRCYRGVCACLTIQRHKNDACDRKKFN